jgi:hypothetical protein
MVVLKRGVDAFWMAVVRAATTELRHYLDCPSAGLHATLSPRQFTFAQGLQLLLESRNLPGVVVTHHIRKSFRYMMSSFAV